MRLTLTKQAEYALRALVWLAQEEAADRGRGQSGRHKAATISTAVGIPPQFAARVLAQLQRRGLLFARAGQHGGYTLARPAEAVSILQVVEAVEGPLRSGTCVLREANCSSDGTCLLHGAWSAAQDSLRAILSRTSIAATTTAATTPTTQTFAPAD